jgi:ribosomal protein L16/L10AE
LFEVGGTDEETARQALRRARFKLSVKTKIVSRDVAGEA